MSSPPRNLTLSGEVLDNLPAAMVFVLADGTISHANREACAVLGLAYDDMLARYVADWEGQTLKEDGSPCPVEEYPVSRCLATGEPQEPTVIGVRRPDGTTSWALFSASPVFNGGLLEGAMVVFVDVTARKLAEQVAGVHEERIRALVDNLPHGIQECDTNGIITVSNPAHARMHGYELDELIGMPVWELPTDPRERERLRDYLAYLVAEQPPPTPFQTRDRTKRGGAIDVQVDWSYRRNCAGELVGFVSVITDITDRLAAQRRVTVLSQMIEQSPIPIMLTDRDGTIEYVNPSFTDQTGFAPEDVLGRNPRMWSTAHHPREFYTQLWNTIRGGRTWRGDVLNRRKNGEEYWELMSITPLRDADGEITHYVAMKVDDTERKLAEQALRSSEERFRAVTLFADDAIIATDDDGLVTVWNAAATRITGYDNDEAVGRPVRELLGAEFAVATGDDPNAARFGHAVETAIAHKTGRLVPVEVSTTTAPMGIGRQTTAIVRDITARKAIDQDLRRLAKLESVGVLAGGIAHDFNNLLTAIQVNIDLAAKHLAPGNRALELLSEAGAATRRAARLTQQLLTFAKGGTPVTQIIEVGGVLQGAHFALRGSNVRCEIELADDLWAIRADRTQLEQVVHNLVINAAQAMPDGGVIELGAHNRVVEPGEALPLTPGRYVVVTLADYGCGIAPENLGRIFDPYFTSKATGSGLGLATAHSIVKSHQGYLTVQSEVGVGTTFTIYLPATTDIAPVASPGSAEPAKPRSARLLVMDDDDMVRRALVALLRDMGCEVDDVADGREAVQRYSTALRGRRPYDAVIMDLTVPGGMSGREALAEIQQIDADVRALVSSGYSNDPVMAHPQRYGFRGIIRKPYSPTDVARAVLAVLARSDDPDTGAGPG